jgi:hypothetical protein
LLAQQIISKPFILIPLKHRDSALFPIKNNSSSLSVHDMFEQHNTVTRTTISFELDMVACF